jgi:two-component system, chemotaxis family, response regulator Rcp1
MRPQVLLVEDNSGDVRLIKEVFRSLDPGIQFYITSDGVEAIAFLKKEGTYVNAVRPDLILLDLNLPRMGGHEVLAFVKQDIALNTIPIVILTTSQAESDILKSYRLRANCYMVKPQRLEDFEALVKSINDFWLIAVKLPKPSTENPPNNPSRLLEKVQQN